MDTGLIVTFAGLAVAAMAGVLGVWMERDREAPTHWAWVFSLLILIAVGVEGVRSVFQAAEDAQTEEALARVLEKLTILSERGDNPALASFVSAELATQARANPSVVKKLEKKVAARGGDPKTIRKVAAEGRRTSAGLPAKKPANLRTAAAGGKARPGAAGAKGTADAGKGTAARVKDGAGAAAQDVAKQAISGDVEGTKKAVSAAADEAVQAATKGVQDAAKSVTEDAKKQTKEAADKAAKDAQKAADKASKDAKDTLNSTLGGLTGGSSDDKKKKKDEKKDDKKK